MYWTEAMFFPRVLHFFHMPRLHVSTYLMVSNPLFYRDVISRNSQFLQMGR